MISGISGNNSIYNYQSTLNQYRLAQALNNNYSNQSSGTAETPRKKAASALNSSISYIKSYNSSMTDLMDSANSLRKVNSSSVMNELSVSSSDTDILTASERFRVNTPQDIDINVTQVATSQVNVSNAVDSSALSEDMSFSIRAGTGLSGDFTISSLKEDGTQKTNQQMLADAAKAINDKDMGISAAVITKDGQSSLKLTSDNTGAGSQFTVSGSYADDSGLSNVSQEAKNAAYTVTKNGTTTSHHSSTNDISLDNGRISVSLKKEGAATVKASVDTGKVISAMESFVSSYNKAQSLLSDNIDRGPGTLRQLNRLGTVLGPKQDQEMLGLSINKDGDLTLDKEKLEASLKDRPELTKDLISGSFGLAQRAFSSTVSSMTTSVGSLIGNDIAEIEYENAISPTNYMNAFSKSGAHNLSNYYSVGLLFNMIV